MTRTYTRYFSEDQTAPLRAVLEELTADAESRAPYIDADARRCLENRIILLRIAIDALEDVAG